MDTHASNLKTMSHDMHEMQINNASNDDVAAAWGKIILECLELKKHIDGVTSVMHPGNYTPHATLYDATLSVKPAVP